MNPPAVCPRCGSSTETGAVCTRCLLETGGGQSLAERIFQAALSLDVSERRAFVRQTAGESPALQAEVELLLEGYEEAGGDDAGATFGGTARERWAAVRREEPGTLIDHFRLVRMIGEGGMGSVWEAQQSQPIPRRVALKIIKLGMDTEEVVRRFERERRTLALMSHPHIARVFEAGSTPAGRPYFAMELVEGQAITTHCAAAGLGVRGRLALFLDVCAAVEHAHQKGVIHRDLKPSNILVSQGAVKVIDFGVAKATQDESGDALVTRAAQVLGTPAYMSPEQAESGGLDVDTRSDVYSLGAVLYEMLSGVLPFDPKRLASSHMHEVQRILREEPPPRPSTRLTAAPGPTPVRPVELHGDLDWIILKALSKERDRRYTGAAAFAADIRRYLDGEAVSAVPPTLLYRFGKFVRRNKVAVTAGASVLAALTVGLVVSLLQVRRANEAFAGEALARREATSTVADLYTRSGISAAESGAPDRAALWFTRAAQVAAADPERVAANRLRASAWTAACSVPVAAFETGMPHIEHMAFHPDGKSLITTQIDRGPVQVWNLETQQQWPPAAGALAASWNTPGDRICIAAGDGLRVLEYPSGRLVAEAAGHAAVRVAFNPAGDLIAAATQPPSVWDWQSGEFRNGPDITGGTKRITWSADGSFILWQAMDRAGICRAADPEHLLFPAVNNVGKCPAGFIGGGDRFFHSFQGRTWLRESLTGAIVAEAAEGEFALAASPEGNQIARATAPLWVGGQRVRTIPDHGPSRMMESARFSPDGTLLVTACYDATVRLWDVAADKQISVVGNHQQPVQCVEWSPDGALIASSQTGLVRVWRLPGRPGGRRIPTAGDSLAALSADGKYIAAAGVSSAGPELRTTRVYTTATGEAAGAEIKTTGIITGAAFAPGNDWIALAVSTTPDRARRDWDKSDGGSGVLEIRSCAAGTLTLPPIPLPSEPRGVAVHPNGEYVAVYCGGGEGVEWERHSGRLSSLFASGRVSQPHHTLNNGRIAYAAGGHYVIAWGEAGVLHCWDRTAAHATPVGPLERGAVIYGLAVFGDIAALAPAGPDEPFLTVINMGTGQEAGPPLRHSDWLYHAAFDDTGRYLISSGRRPVVQVWDWRAGIPAGPALPHSSDVMAALFLPGTPWVITGAHDGFVRFWDPRTGMLIRPPLRIPGMVVQLTLTPDHRHLAVAALNGDGHLEIFDIGLLLPPPAAVPDPAVELLRAEIIAAATVHQSGGIVPLTGNAWLEKWQALRRTASGPLWQ